MVSDMTAAAGNTTVYGLFAARARLQAGHLAIVEGQREIGYGALLNRVNRLANWLRANGVERGDR